MKKTVGMLCGLTILSACADSLVDAPRHQPILNGKPLGAPVSLNTKQPAPKVQTAQAPLLPRNVLVPEPVLNQNNAMSTLSANAATGRRVPDFNRNAFGKGSADVLGPAPAPAVSRTPLAANTPVAPVASYDATPVIPVQKIQSVALNMPHGLIIPAAPAKNAKPLIALPQPVQVAKAPAIKPEIKDVAYESGKADSPVEVYDVPQLPAVADNMPKGSIFPPVPKDMPKPVEVAEVKPEPVAAVVDLKAADPVQMPENKEIVQAAPVAEVKKVETLAEVKEVETAAEIYDVPPLPAVADNMPQGSIFPPVPKDMPKPVEVAQEPVQEELEKPQAPAIVLSARDPIRMPELSNEARFEMNKEIASQAAPVAEVKEVETAAEIYDVPPLQAVADNMPQGSIFPPVPKVEPIIVAVNTPVQKTESVEKTILGAGNNKLPEPTLKSDSEPKLVAQANDTTDVPPPPRMQSDNIGNIVASEIKTEKEEMAMAPAPVAAPSVPEAKSPIEIRKVEQKTVAITEAETLPESKTKIVVAAAEPQEIKKVERKQVAAVIEPKPEPMPDSFAEAKPAEIKNIEEKKVAVIEPKAEPVPAPVAEVKTTALVAEDKPVEVKKAEEKKIALIEPKLEPAPIPAPVAEVKKIDEKKITTVADNNFKREYPDLANMPPAPPVPQPVDADPRVQQMQEELRKAKLEAENTPQPVPMMTAKTEIAKASSAKPVPMEAAPMVITKTETVKTVEAKPTPVESKPEPVVIAKTETVKTIEAKPAPVESEPAPMVITKTETVKTVEVKPVPVESKPEPMVIAKAETKPALLEPPPASRNLPPLPEMPPLTADKLPPISSATTTTLAMATPERPLSAPSSQPVAAPAPQPAVAAPAAPVSVMPEGPTIIVKSDEQSNEKPIVEKNKESTVAAPSPAVTSVPVAPEILPNIIQRTSRQEPTAAPAQLAAPAPVVTASPVYSTTPTPAPNPAQAIPVTRGAPPAFLVPPVVTQTAPQPAPMHAGSSTKPVSSEDSDNNGSSSGAGMIQPASREHHGMLKASRYERLRQGQR